MKRLNRNSDNRKILNASLENNHDRFRESFIDDINCRSPGRDTILARTCCCTSGRSSASSYSSSRLSFTERRIFLSFFSVLLVSDL